MTKAERRARQLAARKVRQDLATIEPTDCHLQRQSLMFGSLPPELRNLIFDLVLTEEPDYTRRYQYRATSALAVMAYVPKLNLDLLRTCRLVYLETRQIPLQKHSINSFYPFVSISKAQPGTETCSLFVRSPFEFTRLTKSNQQDLREVHLNTPEIYEPALRRAFSLQQFTPRIINLTLWLSAKTFEPAKYAGRVKNITFNNELHTLNLRIVDCRDRRTGLEPNVADQRLEYNLTRRDGRQLQLVKAQSTASRTETSQNLAHNLYGELLIWKLIDQT